MYSSYYWPNFSHQASQLFQKVLRSLFQKYEWWHVQLYILHSLYLLHDWDELCHADTIKQIQQNVKHKQQLMDIICSPGTGVLLLLKMMPWSLSSQENLVLWDGRKTSNCLAAAESWQSIHSISLLFGVEMVQKSNELLSILCGSARWKSWFYFSIAFCLNCPSL